MGTNCAPLIADLFLYCYERDFMSNLQKSKRFDLIDKFNDTSRYLDDIFTIDNPTFAEHIPDIYPRELQLNKANTSDKETSFLDLNIKVIGNDIHTSVYDKRDDFGFPIVNFPWLSGDVPRLPSYGIYISQLVRFARCCTSVFDFHSKNLQITSKLLKQDLCKYSIGNVVKTVFISSSTFRPQAFFKKMNLKFIVTFCHLFSLPNVSHVNAVFAVHCDVIHVVFLARCARTLLCCVQCMRRPAPCPL